jgi:transcriptional regulator with XRE-family HTH domain
MAKPYTYADFGSHLKQNIRERYDTLKSFSAASGIPLKQLYDYESGRVFPPIEKFITICRHLDKTATYMLSPLLEIHPHEKELIAVYEEIREILDDEKVAPILQTIILGVVILFKTRRYLEDDNDVVVSLRNIRRILFEEQRVKALK